MSERERHLKRYREIQTLEGLTVEAEMDYARLQGEAWREYVAACKAEGVEPESMNYPGWIR